MKSLFVVIFMLLLVLSEGEGCNILSLSGGGAHGAFQAGVLKRLHSQGKQWDIISGISAGSINTIGLGLFTSQQQEKGIDLLEQVWSNITSDNIYRWNWDPIYDQSFLDTSPLNKTMFNIVKQNGGKANRNIMIGSANLNRGLLRIFTTPDFNSTLRTTTIVMASSAIPVVFPPIYLEGEYYVDGGTYTNELIRPAIKSCLKMGYAPEEITIDLIICTPPIGNITSKEIYSYTIFGMMSRGYDILTNSAENHEIYTVCKTETSYYPLNIYKPLSPYPGGLLDFSHSDLIHIFEMGYNTTTPIASKYCY